MLYTDCEMGGRHEKPIPFAAARLTDVPSLLRLGRPSTIAFLQQVNPEQIRNNAKRY